MNNEKVFDVSWSTILKVGIAFLVFYMLYLIRDLVVWFIFVIQKVYNYGLGSTIFSVLVAGAAYYQTLRIIKGQDVVA